MKKCLNPTCKNSMHSRGLCLACYHSASRLVNLKRVTWETLIKQGKATESKQSAHKVKSEWFLDGKVNKL